MQVSGGEPSRKKESQGRGMLGMLELQLDQFSQHRVVEAQSGKPGGKLEALTNWRSGKEKKRCSLPF